MGITTFGLQLAASPTISHHLSAADVALYGVGSFMANYGSNRNNRKEPKY